MFDGENLLGAHFGDLDSIRMLEKLDGFRCGLYGNISWRHIWHWYFLGGGFNGICDSLGLGLVDEHVVTPVVFQRWSQIPSVSSMGIPRSPLGWFLMEDYFGAWWCQWCLIEIKDPF